MGPHAQSKPGGRLRRASAVVRAWDGPNSRIAFEMDLDQMPWGPFEALGKQVTLLVPEREEEESGAQEATESHLERALRHVEHAAERCAAFAEMGNGNDELWRSSLETWEWLRDLLTATWTEEAGGTAPAQEEPRKPAPAPDMPGAAAILRVAADALRQTPLAVWQEAIGTFSPEAPTREEAIQTLKGVARLLGQAGEAAPARGEDRATAPGGSPAPAGTRAPTADPRDAPATDGSEASAADPQEAPATDPQEASAPSAPDGEEATANDETSEPEPALGADELSFDYASGYDEGYRMGRRVGRALAARERRARGD